MVIAIIGTGPSHIDFFDVAAGYPAIMTCSKALAWLLEKGIVPTYHVDIDPGLHKIPTRVDRNVRFLLGDGVHPAYRALVPDAQRAPGEGKQAGDTSILAAAGLGYTELHCYGFDSSGSGDEDFYFNGKHYRVNENLLGSIHHFENAIRSCGVIKLKLHGDGLLKAYLEKKYGTQIS